MKAARALHIQIRPAVPPDVGTFFGFESDPEGCRVGGFIPRDEATFRSRWAEVFTDPCVIPRAVVDGGTVVGCICVFRHDGVDAIGYNIARAHWGKGYATRAIGLMLEEVRTRPLYAHVAGHNIGSVRALERNGFVITERCQTPGTARYLPGERLTLVLS